MKSDIDPPSVALCPYDQTPVGLEVAEKPVAKSYVAAEATSDKQPSHVITAAMMLRKPAVQSFLAGSSAPNVCHDRAERMEPQKIE